MSPSLQARRECHWPGRDPLRGIPKRIWKMRDGDTRACASSSDMTPLLAYGIESTDLIHHAAVNGIGLVIGPPVRHPCRQTREQLDGIPARAYAPYIKFPGGYRLGHVQLGLGPPVIPVPTA